MERDVWGPVKCGQVFEDLMGVFAEIVRTLMVWRGPSPSAKRQDCQGT